MKRIALTTFLSLVLLNSACMKRAKPNPDRDVSEAFGISVQDSAVDLNSAVDLKPKLKVDDKGQVTFQSTDWLSASHRMFEAAEALGSTKLYESRLKMVKTAHELSSAYYAFPNATLPMTVNFDPAGNPFLEEAYFYVKDILNKQYQTTMTNSSAHVDQAAKKVLVKKLPPFKDDQPIDINAVLDVPIKALDDFVVALRGIDDDTTKEVTEEISANIQKDFISKLNGFKTVLVMKDVRETSATYINRIVQNLKQTDLVSDEDKASALKNLTPIMYYAKKVDLCVTPEVTMQSFIDLWLANDIRAQYPSDVKANVIKIFKHFKDTEVISFLDDNKHKFILPADWDALVAKKPALIKAVVDDPIVSPYAKSLMTTKIDPAKNGFDIFEALVNNWYNMDFRSKLYSMSQLWGFSEKDLIKIRDVNNPLAPGHLILAIKRKVILDSLRNFKTPFPNSASFQPGLEWFRGYINYLIVRAIQEEIAKAIMEAAETIPEKIRVAIHESLKGLKLKSRENVMEIFKKFSARYLNLWIFSEKASLPLIEKTVVKFKHQDGKLSALPSNNETSAEVMGMSLTNSVERLNTIDYVSLKADAPEVRAVAFQTLCKLAALTGYTGVDNQPVPSLYASFSTDKKAPAFDLATYNPSNGVYALADSVPIKKNYKPDLSKRESPKASVRGQMELLAGLTKTLRYLKPWNPSSFDIGMQNLRINEFPSEQIFSKSTFFLQSLGLAATIIKNIPARMVALITLEGAVIPMGKVKDLPSDIGGAVMVDFDKDGISHIVNTHDVALSVVTLSDFFESVSDLSRSSDKTVRDAAAEILSQKPIIDKLFLGISMFSLSKLMSADGGFVTSYNLDTQTASNAPRTLEDQLLMEEAILIIGNFLNRNFIKIRALDNFFFLNSHFFNSRLGFYNSSEGPDKESVKLGDVAEAIKNTVLIKPLLKMIADANPVLRPSLAQLNDLQAFWVSRFFGDQTENLSPILKLGRFEPIK